EARKNGPRDVPPRIRVQGTARVSMAILPEDAAIDPYFGTMTLIHQISGRVLTNPITFVKCKESDY
ncbi:MAG: hypothetical protein ACOVOC_01330, partial [Rhabdaerophilum sp.]